MAEDMDIDTEIRLLALKNAVSHKGKANPGSLVGAILGKHAEWRDKRKELIEKIDVITGEVNKISLEDQQKEIEAAAPEMLEKRKRREGLPPLKDAEKGKVVMRLAPSPSGPLHLGHAYTIALNWEYVKTYGGKFFIRIEDTNPSNIYLPAYDMIPEDVDWLTDNGVADYVIQSDRLNIYYDYAERLINEGHMYICDCDNEEFKELLKKSLPCPCRDLPPETHVKRWKDMFTKYEQGQAVVRWKSDLNHKNPAMRDFPLFRINDEEHPRVGKKYRVWPLMNFSVSIDDMEMGMTHTLRGKDHADNAKRQELIHNVLGFKTPNAISIGRINFEGLPMSTTKTKELIARGEYEGWDDIRLPFLRALKRRGYQPGALHKFGVQTNASKTDKTVAAEELFKQLDFFNKEILDPIADRHFFIKEPVEITIDGAPDQIVELDLHPDNKKGGRTFSTTQTFLIDKEDFDSIEDGKVIRLIDCLTCKKEGNTFKFIGKDYLTYKDAEEKGPIIHWLVDDGLVDVTVRMPDNSVLEGRAEKYVSDVKFDSVIQFERFGFCRCDADNSFWFTHK